MAISKRVLTKWRKEALAANVELVDNIIASPGVIAAMIVVNDRILLMTQELLDQHLLKEANKDV